MLHLQVSSGLRYVLYRQQLNDDNVIRAWTEIVPSFIGRVQVDDNL